MSIIDVDHLTKDYGSYRGVFDVSMHINQGECYGFLGPNGAGKSTTIRHLMGFSKPDSGSCSIMGKESFAHYNEILSKVGYIPGEIALPSGLTGFEFIKMMQDLQHIHNKEMLNKMLSLFKLEDNVLAGETKRMSLGVKRKLAIVAAFMSDPEVLILDEPTSGLDPVMQENFVSFIQEEKKKGKTILLSSHIFSEVDETCDRISIIKDGHVVSEFVADELKHASKKYFQVYFHSADDFNSFKAKADAVPFINVIELKPAENMAFISAEDKDINEVVSLLSGYNVDEFINRKETLEDYFMKFYKEGKDFGRAL